MIIAGDKILSISGAKCMNYKESMLLKEVNKIFSEFPREVFVLC